jgi:opacity protein-like surface antigen
MMKFWMNVLLASFALVPLAATAKAADYNAPAAAPSNDTGIYFRGDVGASWLDWSTATSPWAFTGGAGVGYQFDPNFRTDLTWDWSGNYTVAPGADVKTSVVMGNIYYDWKNDSAITPYVGAGVGYGWQWDNNGAVGNNQGMAVGLAAGVAYDMTNNLALDVGYKFHDIVSSGTSVPEHQGTVGLRVKF